MDYTRLTYLFEQYESDKASDTELNELFALLGNESHRDELLAYFESSMRGAVPDELVDVKKWRPVIEGIVNTQTGSAPVRRINRWWRYAAAAIITCLIGTAIYYMAFNKKAGTGIVDNNTPQIHDVAAPATTNAYVTLADGRTIVLDSVSNGELAKQGNAQLVKLDDGKIAYQGTGGEVMYNTLSNPRGSKVVNLVLADGSTVWLNAASSITYPTSFTGNERVVEITGEAYFEVATFHGLAADGSRQGKIPFIVRKGDMQVRVLGTHFNVNAYDNESNIKVTLLEGSVQVGAAKINRHVILRPGQQAAIYPDELLKIDKADTSLAMAWKNGYFDFNNADLPVVMRQLERWYDITVIYKGQIPRIIFKGQMDRNVRLADVMRFLTSYGIQASLQARTLTISGS